MNNVNYYELSKSLKAEVERLTEENKTLTKAVVEAPTDFQHERKLNALISAAYIDERVRHIIIPIDRLVLKPICLADVINAIERGCKERCKEEQPEC